MNTTEGKNVVASVLARLRNTSKSNGAPFQQVLQQYAIERFLYRISVEPDGLAFLADSVVAEEITKDSEYQGTRISMDARMDNVRLRIQVDFGVGDVIASGPRMIEYPVLLGGDANSRMKDFYDVWICASHLNFETGRLLQAVEATFANRETDIPTDEFEVLTAGFAERHLVQWNVFVKKMG